jgi:hypothetical protein
MDIISFVFVCFFIYCFTSRSRIFHLYGDVIITGEGRQNLGLNARRSVPESLFRHTCCDMVPQFFRKTPQSVSSYDTKGNVEDLF